MYCGNCGKQTSNVNRYCAHCNFDLTYLQKLLNEDDDNDEGDEEIAHAPKSAADVARRSLVLCSVIAVSHGDENKDIASWLKDENLWITVSPQERLLFRSRKATRQQLINASWSVEALLVLLWALRLVPSLNSCDAPADRLRLRALLPFLGKTSAFIANSKLRSEDELHEMQETIYDAHWSLRDAERNGQAAPGGIVPGVIIERHRAINWLMGYAAQSWDDVTTDT